MIGMTRSKRMKPVVKVAEGREQAAARVMGEAQRQLQAQEDKLQELITYRAQYTEQFQVSGGAGLGAARLQDYRVFLSRLNQAIEQQHVRIAQCQQDCERQRSNWMATRTRSQALDKVVERYQREERRADDRREQNETDERAQRGGTRDKE